MLGASLERLGGLFDQRFILAFWAPIFVCASASAAILTFSYGFAVTLAAWLALSGTEQVLLGAASIVSVTVIAYVFSVATGPLIRMYEGYWPAIFKRQGDWALARQKKSYDSLLKQMMDLRGQHGLMLFSNSQAHGRLFRRFVSNFPRDPGRIRPSRIGNILVAAEEYPWLRYNIDSVLWWPRLAAIMPDAFRAQVGANLTPMIAFLNLATVSSLSGMATGAWLWSVVEMPWWGFACIIGGFALARACYLAAATPAVKYGQSVRTAFDLYRFDLLKQMRIPLPPTPKAERKLWLSLGQWAVYGSPVAVSEYDTGQPQMNRDS